jgi:folylpolyglutamate synthase
MSFLYISPQIRKSAANYSFFSLQPIVFVSRGLTTMASPGRSYGDAVKLLNSLQSNNSIRLAISNSSASFNDVAIPEMIEWVRRAGYDVKQDFNKLQVIHVAGTKGKGSVSTIIAAILSKYQGHQSSTEDLPDPRPEHPSKDQKSLGRIGVYTSPHLLSVRERISMDGQSISEGLFAQYFFDIWDRLSSSAAAEGHPDPQSPETKPMYFRYLTIMALHAFVKENVEIAVLECGIGGEYDSTNILPPNVTSVSAITRLGIDHVGMLGNTIEKIAWNKAGIMRAGIECYSAPQPAKAITVLEQRAKEKNASLQLIKRHPDLSNNAIPLGMDGDFQKDNASLAISVAGAYLRKYEIADIPQHDKLMTAGLIPIPFQKALREVKWGGRCEIRKEGNLQWCIDGGHTLDSMEVIGEWFSGKAAADKSAERILIFNQSAQERDAAGLLATLHGTISANIHNRPVFDHAIFCTNDVKHPSSAGTALQEQLAEAYSRVDNGSKTVVCDTIAGAVLNARELGKGEAPTHVLVTGSLYLVGGFLEVLESH